MGRYINNFSQKVAALDKKYVRNQFQTYLTGPEWRNVEMSEEFADFLSQNKPFYRFPFFKQIAVFWKVFFQSYAAARKTHSHLSLIFSEYMLMSLFIGINSSLEFLGKGIVSLLLWPFLKKENNTEFQGHIAAIFKDYADFIHHTPFYNYSYFSQLRNLFSSFWHSKGKSFADVVTLLVVAVDFLAHGIIAAPVGLWYNKEENKEPETIDVIVKDSTDEEIDESDYAADFKSKLEAIEGVSVVSDHEQPQIFVRTNEIKHRTYAYAHLRVPRYEPFQATVEKLTAAGINVREIAGHENIQIKCVVSGETEEQIAQRGEVLSAIEGCTKLYTYQNGVDNGHTFFSMDVNTKHLNKTLDDIHAVEGVEIKLMHDF